MGALVLRYPPPSRLHFDSPACARALTLFALCARVRSHGPPVPSSGAGTLVAVLPLAMSRILIRIARNFTVLLTGVWVRQHARPGTIHPNNNPQVIIACNHRTAFDLLPFIRVCSPSVLLDKGCVHTLSAFVWLCVCCCVAVCALSV